MPVIDGKSLASFVSEFENRNGYSHKLEYGGLDPGGFQYGPLEPYFLGSAASDYWTELDGIYLLGCRDCGNVGCWPLVASVTAVEHLVVWTNFRQPHRTLWDYSGFGPFNFEISAYVDAIRNVVDEIQRR